MCGIFGIFTQNESLPRDELLANAVAGLHHRGPDNGGSYRDGKVFLAHNRLKIIDLSDRGNQPLANEDNSAYLVFNGEIYNYKELRHKLRSKGHVFRGDSDSEVILHLYEDLGTECVHHLRGMFSFAIWDKKKGRLFAARDHLGIKPFHYFINDRGTLFFSSEIKAFKYLDSVPFKYDEEALYHYLTFGSVPIPRTIINGVKSLRPGHLLLHREQCEIKKYWETDFSGSQETDVADGDRRRKLRSLLEDAVESHMVSDVPVGAFLSGGVDSTIIVALMSKIARRPVKTFTIGYDVKGDFDETGFARLAAERYSTDHHETRITEKDVLDHLDKAIWHMDQPSHDALNSYFVSLAARQTGLRVAFSGLGADELFAGYSSFKFAKKVDDIRWFADRVPAFATRSWEKAGGLFPRSQRYGWRWKGISAGMGCYPRLSQQYHQAKLFFDEREKKELCSRDFLSRLDSLDYESNSLAVLDEMVDRSDTADVINNISNLEINSYLASTLLRDTDAMSMANSLEVRVPFLDRALVEFAASLPGYQKLNGSGVKFALADCVRDIVPDQTLNRKKRGFAFPLGLWLKGEGLREIVDDCLSKDSITKRGLFNYEIVDSYKREFYKKDSLRNGQLYMRVWLLAVLELWSRAYLDKNDNSNF